MDEYVLCNLCLMNNANLLFVKDCYKIVKCQSCGLIYVNPRPTANRLSEFYNATDSAIWNSEASDMYELYTTNKNWVTNYYYQLRLKPIEQLCSKPGRLLDVGCASGVFLAVARELGWETYGFEPQESTSRIARDKLDLNIFSATSLRDYFPDEYFDVVSIWDVLEHTMDPMGILKDINRVLKPGGILQLRTPNIDSMLFYITRKNWLWLIPPAHLYYFFPAILKTMLRKAGFQVIEEKTILSSTYLSLITNQFLRFVPSLKIRTSPKVIQSKGIYFLFQFLERAISTIFSPLEWLLRRFHKGAMIHIYVTKNSETSNDY